MARVAVVGDGLAGLVAAGAVEGLLETADA